MAAQSQRQASLEQAIKEVVTQLFDEVEESKVKPVDQLRRLSKLAADLQKEIREMKTHPPPSTPPKVL